MTHDRTIRLIANIFSALLLAELGPNKMYKIRKENERRRVMCETACAAQDYCDANVVMEISLQCVVPGYTGFDIDREDDVKLFNDAWALAKQHRFTVLPVPGEVACTTP